VKTAPTGWLRPRHVVPAALVLFGALGLYRVGPADGSDQRQDPLAEPFRGVTTDGTVMDGLFPIRVTGVSTAPMREAMTRFLAALTPEQREETMFPVDDIEWRAWNNVHRYDRKGVSFREMNEDQRAVAFDLLRASLSVKGFETSRDIMRLNGTIAEIRDNWDEYGDDLYNLTVMGEPSATDPWGWQLDGHHLIINWFNLGDQVVMTPTFMGSEPVRAETGRWAGTVVLQPEQDVGLAFMQSLDAEQRSTATLETEKPANNSLAQAFRDNLVLDYAGLRATSLSAAQREGLLRLIAEYVNNMDEGHARVRMEEVRAHLDDTWFAWIGDVGPEAIFYYRIQSPVILIEFDHQRPVALEGPRVPGRNHIHSVVRTPNGNDYGKDLLRQHYEAHRNDPAHGHQH
jgi:hypothetical protein